MSKISVIMPSLNVATYIEECLDSVLAQTGCELQIFCIDAGSTDGTEEILKRYSENNKQVSYIHSDIKSYGHQINMGLETADGDYVAVLETDDLLPKGIYSKMVSILENDRELDFVKGSVMSFREKCGQKEEWLSHMCPKGIKPNEVVHPKDDVSIFLDDPFLWRGIYRRDFVKDIRINETPGAAYQDVGFLLQSLHTSKNAMYINDIAYYYRQGREGASVVSHNGMKYLLREFTLNDRLIDKNDTKWQKAVNARLLKMICVRLHLMAWGEYWQDAEDDMQSLKERLLKAEKTGLLDFSQLIGNEDEISLAKIFLESPRKAYNALHKPIVENRKVAGEFIKKLKGNKIVIVTAGKRASFLKRILERTEGTDVVAICDNSETRQGEELEGIKITSIHGAAEQYKDACFVVATKSDTDRIKEQLLLEKINSDRIMLFDLPCSEELFETSSL